MRKMLWIGGSLAVAWLAVQGVYVVRVVRAHRRAKHTQALRRWRDPSRGGVVRRN